MREVKIDDIFYSNRVKITRENDGCWSYVGAQNVARNGGSSSKSSQQMNLAPGCEKGTVPQHEFMHALGFWHEHQRGDADQHVDFHREKCDLSEGPVLHRYEFCSINPCKLSVPESSEYLTRVTALNR